MPMRQYFFILGREPELSVTEIWRVAKKFGLTLGFVAVERDFLVVQAKELDIAWWQERLGGTIKIGEVVGRSVLDKDALQVKLSEIIKPARQIYFGFSWYSKPPKWDHALGIELKKQFKEHGKVRYVVSRDKILSSVVVKKNHLLPPVGYEFVFLPAGDELLIGVTLSVQPFEEFSHRDFDRPSRDAYVGMLPPKLARMMINISGASADLLDPFCGSGTILQEAALLGTKDLTGSDSNLDSINRTKENIKWLREKNNNLDFQYNIYHEAIETLPAVAKKTFSTIVSEPFLGKPMTGRESKGEVLAVVRELTLTYTRWLKIISHLLSDNGSIVMVWPAFSFAKELVFLPLDNVLADFKLKRAKVIPDFIPKDWLSPRGTLLYFRPGQRVAREIIVLEKV